MGALLGRIVSIVKDPPHRWEVTREEFDKILQQESPAYSSPSEQPLPSDFAEVNIPEQTVESLLNKEFVEAIRKIEYDKQIPDAVSDYWKAEMTVMKYFKDDFLYLKSLPLYKNELERKLKYLKESKVIETEGMNRNIEIRNSKLMYTEVMRWDAKDIGSIVRNQGYFQRGIIHTIVDDKKFSWDVGEEDEY
nr:ABC-three component system protein [Bacillus amyloliquefaciens]